MLPQAKNIEILQDFEIRAEPNLTYQIQRRSDLENDEIKGDIVGLEAMRQAIYKIIFTEQRDYVIYSWGYGIRLRDLFGKPIPLVRAELPQRFIEALLRDDRISGVMNFTINHERTRVFISFDVMTNLGIVPMKNIVFQDGELNLERR